MKILKLVLKNYRNHKDLDLDLDGKSVLIRGVNASGKSNILEAIHLVSTTKSLRTRYDKELINHQENVAYIGTKILKDNAEIELDMSIAKNDFSVNASKKRVKINKVNKSLSKFSGTLNSVLFTPTDIEILTGAPSLRRKYMDSIFFQIDPDYKKAHSDYTKAVRQRNKVLEQIFEAGTGKDQLNYWNTKIIELGSRIQNKRTDLFDYIQNHINEYTSKLDPNNTKYRVDYIKNELSEERLNKYEHAEIMSRRTLVGPHRDDFNILFDEFDMATYGSRGQQRTTLLAVKLCELDFINKNTGTRPVLLLDDIFSELDPLHKEAIDSITDLQQTIITTATDSSEGISTENM